MSRFAISTVWNSWRHKKAEDIVSEFEELGFDRFELSFGLPPALLEDFRSMVESGRIRVTSLHNFCPAPILAQGERLSHSVLPLSSPDDEVRKESVNQTRRTIIAAHELRAAAVVLHMGKIPLHPLSIRLVDMLENGDKDTGRYRRLIRRIKKKREKKKGIYLKASLASLKELAPVAEKLGVRLGLETRYYPEEIPSLEELGYLISESASSAVGYWHDFGHAQFKENLGWEEHKSYLKLYGSNLIGAHIHDIIRSRDHKAPTCGEYDFSWAVEILRKDIPLVFEIHPSATADEIKAGRRYLENLVMGSGGNNRINVSRSGPRKRRSW